MSALGQNRPCAAGPANVRFAPKADTAGFWSGRVANPETIAAAPTNKNGVTMAAVPMRNRFPLYRLHGLGPHSRQGGPDLIPPDRSNDCGGLSGRRSAGQAQQSTLGRFNRFYLC